MQPSRPAPDSASTSARRTSRLPRGARRQQLLRAARDVFVAQGFHAAAMDDIADRAGVSKPVLYQHFPGKRELYLALLEQQVDELSDRVREAMAGTDDNRIRVDGAVGAYFDFIDAEGEAFRLVFESDLRNDTEVRAAVDRGARQCIEAIAEVIAVETGADPERALLAGRQGHAVPGRGGGAHVVAGVARHVRIPSARGRQRARLTARVRCRRTRRGRSAAPAGLAWAGSSPT
jgi:AcrR family transcriptional regulator